MIALAALLAFIAVGPAVPGLAAPVPPSPAAPPHVASSQRTMVRLQRTFITEGSYPVNADYPVVFAPPYGPESMRARCGNRPLIWHDDIEANLHAGFATEKAYLQENDKYGRPSAIGFDPEPPDRFCVKYTIVVGHYADQKESSAYFITARHIAGGPTYCITDIDGKGHPAGNAGASSGAPIPDPEACAALPGP